MSSLTAYTALRTWFDTNWLATLKRFENETLASPEMLEPFVYMELRGGLFDQMSFGSPDNFWREEGNAYFFVCVASGTGVLMGQAYATTLVEMMRGLLLAPGIVCREISVGIAGPFSENGNYFSIPVITKWQRDTTAVNKAA